MIVASVCSGIGGAELAFQGMAEHAFMSETEPFLRAVLRRHFPHIQLHGDFREIRHDGPVDVLVGGTPCQSFSVAGLRRGMDDERGNLALEYLRLAQRLRPAWVLWENVPGVLSSNDGRDFGAFVGGLAELGYGVAWRCLDAQHFGLAQRRKRVFVVGCLGDWRRAAAVLFEPASLRGHPAPSREAGEGTAPTLASRATAGGGLGTDFDCDGGLIAHSLRANGSLRHREDGDTLIAYGGNNTAGAIDLATAVRGHDGSGWHGDFDSETFVAMPLLEIGKGSSSRGEGPNGAGGGKPGQGYPAVAFTCSEQSNGFAWERDVAPTLDAHPHSDMHNIQKGVRIGSLVRRLTPIECERLQGFHDGWTDIEWRGKRAADGPRYRALGNAFAVPVVRWIAKRLAMEHMG